MIEPAFAKQVASILAPALPYLMGTVSGAGQKVAEMARDKLGKESYSTAKQIYDKIWSEVEKKPKASEALREVAENEDDELARAALPSHIKKILEGMPAETVDEIRSIISVSKSETRTVIADRGGIAVGGDVHGDLNAGYHGTEK